ncbi:MAG: hypothetical protein WBS24_14560 [Terriglobales bacterium]
MKYWIGSARMGHIFAWRKGIALAVATTVLLAVAGCSKPPKPADDASTASSAPKESGLESIPQPDPAKYPKLDDMSNWKNPYFVVREDGLGLVDLENHEVHILTPEQIPAELASLGWNAWPYGRVVLVTEAAPKNPTPEAKAEVRKNRALLAGTLKELGVVMQEFP